MLLSIVIAAASLSNPLPAFCEEPQVATAENVRGTWSLQTYPTEGVTRDATEPDTTFQGQRIQLRDGEWIAWYTGSPAPPYEPFCHRLRFNATPARPFGHFDYWTVGPNGEPDSWKKVGIYKLEKDRLTICFRVQEIPGPPVERPTQFDASKGTHTGIAVYRRDNATNDGVQR